MTVDIINADAREGLARFPDGHFHSCVSSPPYWGLRDYGLEPTVWGPDCEHEWGEESYQRRSNDGGSPDRKQETNAGAVGRDEPVRHAFCRRCNAWRGTLGLEPTPELYVEHLVSVMREVRRTLRDDGTLWLNLGDSYASGWPAPSNRRNIIGQPMAGGKRGPMRPERLGPGLKEKDLVGIPWMVAFALRADGWWLRSDIVWSKPNPMPESVTDRPTRSHEYLFLLTKSARYAYDQEAIREPAQDWGSRDRTNWKARDPQHNLSKPHTGGEDGDFAAAGRNRRSVWTIATQPFGLEMCGSCKTIYSPAQYRRLRGGSNPRCNHEVVVDEPCGGTVWLAQDGGAMCASCETFYTAKQLERLPRAAKCRGCGSEEWLSHFAVFPEKLVEPCILTTSEWGCCPECGAPWERVVERVSTGKSYAVGKSEAKRGDGLATAFSGYDDGSSAPEFKTTGWDPTCDCLTMDEARTMVVPSPVPCRILDPFAGSGTVGVVTERLGRHSVLIDAKEEYCEMARHRTAQMGLMLE